MMSLAPHHLALLERSAIALAVATDRGYRTVTDQAELHRLGFVKSCSVPGLLMPIRGVDGLIRTYQYRPDFPRLARNGRPRKYEFPYRSTQVLDVPVGVAAQIGDPTQPLFITEGARKADAAVSAGLVCISVSGVWNWRGTNSKGGKTALPDWEHVALNDRVVYLVFDSDCRKPQVQYALDRLEAFLHHRGARVIPLFLRADHANKVGLDDYLATGGSATELVTLTTPHEPAQAPTPLAAADAMPYTLQELENVFDRWIPDGDAIPLRVLLATYAANRHLDGDPVWMMLVGGSGVGKTERLVPLSAMPDVVLASDITGPAALLSGTSKKEVAKDATGGLLRQLPSDRGMLVLKDFTSVLDMPRDARAQVLAALREMYDGRWDRIVGADGGRTLTWSGRLAIVAGCTSAIDSHHAVISIMGTRFLYVRLRSSPDIVAAALNHAGEEAVMRQQLREAVRGFLEHLPGQPYGKTEVGTALMALASLVARARSPVERDQRSEIRFVPDAEMPTRIVKMLAQLWRAAGLVGIPKPAAWDMVRRVAIDSVPKLRGLVLTLLEPGQKTIAEIAKETLHPESTARRALEDLAAHGVVVATRSSGKAEHWQISPACRRLLDESVPVLSGQGGCPAANTQRESGRASDSCSLRTEDADKTEKEATSRVIDGSVDEVAR